MREIKFRAWDDDGGRMLTHEHENLAGDLLEAAMSGGMPIMQYTGLKDSKGREIYEGDLLRYPHRDAFTPELGTQSHDVATVRFESGCFMAGGDYLDILANVCGRGEVIGNIYENPELLEVKL